jgi:hypothetical protein
MLRTLVPLSVTNCSKNESKYLGLQVVKRRCGTDEITWDHKICLISLTVAEENKEIKIERRMMRSDHTKSKTHDFRDTGNQESSSYGFLYLSE